MHFLPRTFDNFLTWDGSPPPLAPWQPAVPVASETTGGQLRLVFNIDPPRRFFRRKSL